MEYTDTEEVEHRDVGFGRVQPMVVGNVKRGEMFVSKKAQWSEWKTGKVERERIKIERMESR